MNSIDAHMPDTRNPVNVFEIKRRQRHFFKPTHPFRQLDTLEQERVLDAILNLTAEQTMDLNYGGRKQRRAAHIQNIRAYILNDDMWGLRRIR